MIQRILCAALLCILFSFSISAQEEPRNWQLGISVGAALHNVYAHDAELKFKSRFSPVLFGIFAERTYSERFSTQLEFDYVQKGPQDFNIDYLILSILPKHRLGANSNLSIYYGGYVGYLFRYLQEAELIEHDRLQKLDIGIKGGLEYAIDLGNNRKLLLMPRIDLGAAKFSYSKHISYQFKIGFQF